MWYGLFLENCMRLTNTMKHSNIFRRWRGSSAVEQGTHKPLVVGSNPTPATQVAVIEKISQQDLYIGAYGTQIRSVPYVFNNRDPGDY